MRISDWISDVCSSDLRSRADFQAALERRATFSLDASARLDMLVNWLNLALGVRKTLDSFATHWPQPVADMRAQLASLFADGFVAAIPDANWSRMAIYLRALQVRLERLQNKSQRDEDLTKQVAPFAAQLPDLSRPARWLIEGGSVALFAQALKEGGRPS